MGSVRNSIKLTVAALTVLILLVVEWYWYNYNHSKGINSLPAGRFTMKETHIQYPGSPVVTFQMELVTVHHLHYDTSDEVLQKREKEYMTVLKRNLNHDLVKSIRVLTTDAKEFMQRIKNLELSNQSKLLTVELKSVNLLRDVFEYISQNLVGIDVMYLHGDIYLGSGFNLVDPAVIRENKTMYALTRQVKKEEACGEKDKCVEIDYIGSHDAFLFHLTEPIPESALKDLEFTNSSWGMENIVIWIFKTKLKYCVLNPCSVLEVFHLHCSNLRNHRVRVNNDKNTGLSPFTKELVCTSHHP